ncbi:MAG: permease-like cell division protein FtsX [Sphingobacteriaceae bacterium]|nr:permease-like cell division protein FtsX [Sphingobacteriaceae bacterium]
MSEQSQLKYFRRKARRTTITAVISISLVLFLLGLFSVLVMNAKMLSDYVKEHLEVQIYLNEEAELKDIKTLERQLQAMPYVKQLDFVSKEAAVAVLTEDLGEDFVDFLGYNPLLSSFNMTVTADFANTDSLKTVKEFLLANAIVKEVYYQENVLDLINKNLRTIALVIAGFSALLLLITVTLINNSIRLSLYSQRFLIKSMQLVGATAWFIKKPYLFKSFLQGLVSVFVAISLLYGVMQVSDAQLPELKELRNDTFTLYIGIGMLLIGLVISLVSTWFAISKYLRNKIDDLY